MRARPPTEVDGVHADTRTCHVGNLHGMYWGDSSEVPELNPTRPPISNPGGYC